MNSLIEDGVYLTPFKWIVVYNPDSLFETAAAVLCERPQLVTIDKALEYVSAEDASYPAEGTSCPAEGAACLVEDTSCSTKDTSCSTKDASPAEDTTCPAEGVSSSTEGASCPTKDTSLAEGVTRPAEDATGPAEDVTIDAVTKPSFTQHPSPNALIFWDGPLENATGIVEALVKQYTENIILFWYELARAEAGDQVPPAINVDLPKTTVVGVKNLPDVCELSSGLVSLHILELITEAEFYNKDPGRVFVEEIKYHPRPHELLLEINSGLRGFDRIDEIIRTGEARRKVQLEIIADLINNTSSLLTVKIDNEEVKVLTANSVPSLKDLAREILESSKEDHAADFLALTYLLKDKPNCVRIHLSALKHNNVLPDKINALRERIGALTDIPIDIISEGDSELTLDIKLNSITSFFCDDNTIRVLTHTRNFTCTTPDKICDSDDEAGGKK